jgi:hypothetical protein
MSDQVIRLIVSRVLSDLLDRADGDLRSDVRTTWLVGDRKGAALAGRPAGAVQLKKSSRRAIVTDAAAFEAWAADRGELESVTVSRVRPAFEAAVVKVAKEKGAAVTSDGEEIPGIVVVDGEPTVAVTLSDDAEELVRKAWESGELWEIVGSLLPALEAAGGGA